MALKRTLRKGAFTGRTQRHWMLGVMLERVSPGYCRKHSLAWREPQYVRSYMQVGAKMRAQMAAWRYWHPDLAKKMNAEPSP